MRTSQEVLPYRGGTVFRFAAAPTERGGVDFGDEVLGHVLLRFGSLGGFVKPAPANERFSGLRNLAA